MLLIAVMVMLPVLDAFSCALEPDSAASHSTELVLDDEALDGDALDRDAEPADESGQSEPAHGACAHNHCHASTALVPSVVVMAQDFPLKEMLRPDQDDSRLSNVYEGLIRPPRI